MNLKSHQQTFELLSLTPEISDKQLKELDEIEQKWLMIFPPSVREWYSIKEGQKFLETNTFLYDSFFIPNSMG
ncbi:MAG: hypothetical protein ABFS56_06375 [Pseudomonadota bacterium]